ncbi:MAG: hypothetical protein A2V70_19855 [Planctomycetes bacterium RBG_13_63_9]|nr:MAG: hypothetical protein A2V70_19855 [Planctomycetes bacterium RBG_13_63_9]
MSRNPLTVRPATPTEEVAKMMDGARIRHLLVCNNKERLLGIISDRDFQYRGGATAGALMTP